jgi:chemotaxis protein CheC
MIMSNLSLEEVNSRYYDVLKEIGNIGAGNATSAMADLLGKRIAMTVPDVRLMQAKELPLAIGAEEQTVIGILVSISKDINGCMMFLLDIPSARYLVNTLMRRQRAVDAKFDEMELSALKEIGNIITGSYLQALAEMTRLKFKPSVPSIAVDMAASILSVPAIHFGQYGELALLIQTRIEAEVPINGYYIFMPEEGSYDPILSALGMEL